LIALPVNCETNKLFILKLKNILSPVRLVRNSFNFGFYKQATS